MDADSKDTLPEPAASPIRAVDTQAGREALYSALQSEHGELFLAELRERRERLKRLIQAITERARQEEPPRRAPAAARHRCRGLAPRSTHRR
jgi:hypothetical protein